MKFIRRFIEKIFTGSRAGKAGNGTCRDTISEPDFRQRYHTFKLLLSANNRALEAMADMETLLKASRPFGMTDIRALTTSSLVNVFRMMQKLDALAPGKYRSLFDRFDAIRAAVEKLMEKKALPADRRLVIPLEETDKQDSDLVGGKMANLGELKNRLGLEVPRGFAITARAYEDFLTANDLQAEINRRIQASGDSDIKTLFQLCADIQTLIINARVPESLARAVRDALDGLVSETGHSPLLALRSSAIGEDRGDISFAGQYQSLLNVSANDVLDAYKQVVAGKYSLTAVTYRMNRGFRDEDIPMCVGCISMVDALASGVIYSHNPFDIHDDSVFIHSTLGLSGDLVDGSGTADLFVVRRGKEGASPLKVIHTEVRNRPSISRDTIRRLTELTVKTESHYGIPLDIEWAMTGPPESGIYILQCRPLGRKPGNGRAVNPVPAVSDNFPVLARGGITASPGIAAGRIFPINSTEDLLGFPDGAVLLASHALARWASVLGRAAAVITGQGSFAGHLANVSREFGVPALFSLDGAVTRLPAGMVVTVDADNGVVYEGRVEALLDLDLPKANLMAGSPVYGILEEICGHIVPLNLLDPDDIEFKPENCRTLHDITRYIHERSVREMFHYGKTRGNAGRTAKQLFHKVAMQWWVLNLDNGFTTEVPGRYIRTEQIASRPMLAVWEGITAVPWDGPPPVNTRGFLSVMFRATTNTALNTGQRSKYADKNFFIISKEYCSLSARLGFHFTILESFAGKRPQENYITFRFQGGAADFNRRLSRVSFIGDLLSRYGFDTIIKQDNLSARIKGGDQPYILGRLRLLGYMIIHTRQLDMVISDEHHARQYRNRFKHDIDRILRQDAGNN
ncbi:MAG: PEP-utilizing enzyme [Desulfobacterales bacterium]|nr:PEP-utilizing enzyme [Desulfobacterales bacterium]